MDRRRFLKLLAGTAALMAAGGSSRSGAGRRVHTLEEAMAAVSPAVKRDLIRFGVNNWNIGGYSAPEAAMYIEAAHSAGVQSIRAFVPGACESRFGSYNFNCLSGLYDAIGYVRKKGYDIKFVVCMFDSYWLFHHLGETYYTPDPYCSPDTLARGSAAMPEKPDIMAEIAGGKNAYYDALSSLTPRGIAMTFVTDPFFIRAMESRIEALLTTTHRGMRLMDEGIIIELANELEIPLPGKLFTKYKLTEHNDALYAWLSHFSGFARQLCPYSHVLYGTRLLDPEFARDSNISALTRHDYFDWAGDYALPVLLGNAMSSLESQSIEYMIGSGKPVLLEEIGFSPERRYCYQILRERLARYDSLPPFGLMPWQATLPCRATDQYNLALAIQDGEYTGEGIDDNQELLKSFSSIWKE